LTVADLSGTTQTVVDLPRILPWRWSICPGFALTVVDLPPNCPDGGRSADVSSACRGGRSATVLAFA